MNTPPLSRRLGMVPPYLFAELDRLKKQAIRDGIDVIDCSIGDPVDLTPEPIIEELNRAARVQANQRYPSYDGSEEFRAEAADWYSRLYGVELDPESEVLALIGAKEGVQHLSWAVLDEGDVSLVPEPGYPVYGIGAKFTGGEPYFLPLTAENNWLPRLDEIPADILKRARLLWLNYPHNPTGAVAPRAFFEEAVAFCREHSLWLVQDFCYSEVFFDERPPSVLQIEGARDVAVELMSHSKLYNMTGWRIAFAAGNAELIRALGIIKKNTDSGQFTAIQRAGIVGLTRSEEFTTPMIETYRERREIVRAGLREAGIEYAPGRATIYVWARIPGNGKSKEFCARLLKEAGIMCSPGVGFGPSGEGWFRISLSTPTDRLKEAADRLKKFDFAD